MRARGLETCPSLEFLVARRSQHVLQSPFHWETNASQIAISWGRAGAAQGYRMPGARVWQQREHSHRSWRGIWLLLLPNRYEEGRGHCLGDELDTPGKSNPVLEQYLRCLYIRLRWQRNDIVTASKGTTLQMEMRCLPNWHRDKDCTYGSCTEKAPWTES